MSPLEIALEGMRSSYNELMVPDLSPGDALTHFSHYVSRAAQLRNQFRREYKRRTGKGTGKNWAGEIWKLGISDSEIAELFHELRNAETHEAPFVIAYEEETVFEERMGDRTVFHTLRCERVRVTQASGLFSKRCGPSLRMYADEGGQEPLPVVRYTRRYLLEVSTERLQELMQNVGTDDITELTTRHMRIIEKYIQWFDNTYPLVGGRGEEPAKGK